ncbi:MAG: hypothetical protein A3J48_04125 [Candidatus Doudnabacteria bacterium RIFCSPHIGHO2_02_FULL_46_11]|uniref:Bacteriophage Mx8 p63 C-terminal domain-containing protein n=2 Tax=Bacteria candidate phyla TaxID=1783234 RepID=A0A1F5P9F7_9BACT|nr:MAG: hypothetical protein A3I57_02150 [Candidatus Beckwithbacteria bacterium RIFCSPLOWO2_02_FULL_47_23]OGE86300.1 MAG: hypothetical protein A3J48_04125 [Candidatus Doudnabacteria bacterium RIFCSPHIGHO2_02_FULL_46_11]
MKSKLPKAWGSGPIRLNGVEIECAILMDGTPILNKGRMMKALKRPWRGKSRSDSPTFIGAMNLQPFIKSELRALFAGIEYLDKGRKVTGYDAKILPLVCQVYRDAQRASALTASQLPTAQACEVLSDAFAITGLTALIYEQLGYEKFKHPEAFRMLIESYMAEEVRKWSKEYPDELFFQMDRIYGNQPTTSRNRPMYYAKFIRKYIYTPIEKGEILRELDTRNPRNKKGNRKYRHHSHLSVDVGLPAMKAQIWQVLATLKISSDKRRFENNYARMMGQAFQENLFYDLP